MTENEFLLQDRLTKIKSTIEKYGEENFYLSFSGGKDSTVLSALLDMACPGNKIPRVYANTGIEYRMILDFVEREREREHPWELHIIKPSVPIKPMLEKVGYPFKSKHHAHVWEIFANIGIEKSDTVSCYLKLRNPKSGIIRFTQNLCPKILTYQFYEKMPFKISSKCCDELKKKPIEKWKKENKKIYGINGIMPAEGGQRTSAKCTVFVGDKLKNFQPLVPITKEWEDWFIAKYNIEICAIYKEPYNFDRTGCKGCPFAIHLQDELDTLEKFFPAERKQCEIIWAPVYAEYRRLGYRLKQDERQKKGHQMTIEEFLEEV